MPYPCTAPATGSKTIATAGTPLQITSTSTPVSKIILQAHPDNTGLVAVGWSNAIRASGTINGPVLSAGGTLTMGEGSRRQQQFDVADLWFDVSVSGEKILYLYT